MEKAPRSTSVCVDALDIFVYLTILKLSISALVGNMILFEIVLFESVSLNVYMAGEVVPIHTVKSTTVLFGLVNIPRTVEFPISNKVKISLADVQNVYVRNVVRLEILVFMSDTEVKLKSVLLFIGH